jgi:hypothetical protein
MMAYNWEIQNEYDWFSTSDVRRLWDCVKGRTSERKSWLLACALCRRLPGYLESDADRLVLEAAERYVEGEDSLQEMLDHFDGTKWDIRFHRLDAWEAVSRTIESIWVKYEDDERPWAEYADILRDIFGNPFQPAQLDRGWLTPEVVSLAQIIYEQRAFHLMSAVADALAEAGCSNDEILSHCRRPACHVRGCWVVDLILNKN